MQKIRTCLQKTPNALLCALGAVVFLAGFYFLCYRTPLNEVWLPTTMNNDEALYNRQVVSVLTHGGPQGYFGYQESTADIGRYGTWGPLLIWAYALPGLLFGASVNVVLWCNLLLIAVGIAVFARCARLNYWQCIALCGALFSIMLPLRSCVSGASEAMHYMLALLIINSNEVHSIQAPVRNETIVLQIPLKQFSDYFTAQRFIRFRSRNEESEETDKRMVSLIREMYRVYVSGETGYEFRIRAVFYEVLYLMVSAYRETEVEENALKISRRLDALSKITTYMREHYKEDLRLSGLAAMFGYSDAYLSRMFRKYAKVNFKTYLQDIRMAYAYKELLHTDHTISSIALDNGFASSRAFSREFVKRYGILPGRVERQNHKNVKKVL